MEEAILSWYNNLYMPIVTAIKKQRILRRFKGRTAADLYVWIIKYWDDLKKKFGDSVTIDDAASEFSDKFGIGFLKRVASFLARLFKSK